MEKIHKHPSHAFHGVSEHYGTFVARFSNNWASWTVKQEPDGSFNSGTGCLHNLDGPALRSVTGDNSYCIDDIHYRKEQWEKLAAGLKFTKDFNGLLGAKE